ncbi:helix-turn-helix transcriptional regulator [Caulobacter sp.]|uniref:helix-turn-helix transcriptional regulator n=1 Tax=Caulobacter sp. TaxID=78 RepID=UPI0025C403D4|nr:helix-turn-helix transcriptional regulator [Caulobacter sp.]
MEAIVAPSDPKDAEAALRQELRRGALVLAVLAALHREQCGSDLMPALARTGVMIDAGALYPMLRRLETQGLLVSEWRLETGRRRRYYRTSAAGETVLSTLTLELEQLTQGLQTLKEHARAGR